MKGKGIIAFAMGLVIALGMAPGTALAAEDSGTEGPQATSAQPQTQASADLGQCTVKWTGGGYVGGKTDTWQMFYAKGKSASVTPKFALYLGSEKVDPSKYTVTYKLTWWDDAKGKVKSNTDGRGTTVNKQRFFTGSKTITFKIVK